jgi:hypothetical protein
VRQSGNTLETCGDDVGTGNDLSGAQQLLDMVDIGD